MTALQRAPGQPIPVGLAVSTQRAHRGHTHAPLLALPDEPDVRLTHAPAFRLAGMLRPIKNQDFARDRFGGDQVWVLGHVPRAVDLALVVDALYDLYAGLRGKGVATQLATLIVVVTPVEAVGGGTVITFWKVDGGDLKVVLGLSGRVGTEQDTVYGVRLICRSAVG